MKVQMNIIFTLVYDLPDDPTRAYGAARTFDEMLHVDEMSATRDPLTFIDVVSDGKFDVTAMGKLVGDQ